MERGRIDSIVEKLTDEQIHGRLDDIRLKVISCLEFRDAFSAFDADNNGFITTKELANILRSMGLNPTEKELCRLINEVDFDGNGKIDFREFVNMMILNGEQIAWNENDLVEAFRTFDTENKGYILSAELRYVLSRIDDETAAGKDLRDMFLETNLHVNRKITFNEFKGLAKPEIKLHSQAIEQHQHFKQNKGIKFLHHKKHE